MVLARNKARCTSASKMFMKKYKKYKIYKIQNTKYKNTKLYKNITLRKHGSLLHSTSQCLENVISASMKS